MEDTPGRISPLVGLAAPLVTVKPRTTGTGTGAAAASGGLLVPEAGTPSSSFASKVSPRLLDGVVSLRPAHAGHGSGGTNIPDSMTVGSHAGDRDRDRESVFGGMSMRGEGVRGGGGSASVALGMAGEGGDEGLSLHGGGAASILLADFEASSAAVTDDDGDDIQLGVYAFDHRIFDEDDDEGEGGWPEEEAGTVATTEPASSVRDSISASSATMDVPGALPMGGGLPMSMSMGQGGMKAGTGTGGGSRASKGVTFAGGGAILSSLPRVKPSAATGKGAQSGGQ